MYGHYNADLDVLFMANHEAPTGTVPQDERVDAPIRPKRG
jgi:hypothetical protein